MTSCDSIKNLFNKPDPIRDTTVVTEQIFNCGPRPSNWPLSEVLAEYSSAEIIDLANEYWFWGARCDQQLGLVRSYVKCDKGDKTECKKFEDTKKRLQEENQ